jgi:DNA-3-methyladenine glycosylase II
MGYQRAARKKSVPSYWERACRELRREDPILADLITAYPDVTLRSKGTAFQTLLRAIIGQQISVKAAAAVWKRFESALARSITPSTVLSIDQQTLRDSGLSRQKIGYIKDLAEHFDCGLLRPQTFRSLDDQELIQNLTAVKGIGQWTAEMFLIFQLQRPDIFPVQDIGLLRAIERHYLPDQSRIMPSDALEYGERWRPWRTVATWYLWRSLDPFPVEY